MNYRLVDIPATVWWPFLKKKDKRYTHNVRLIQRPTCLLSVDFLLESNRGKAFCIQKSHFKAVEVHLESAKIESEPEVSPGVSALLVFPLDSTIIVGSIR